MDDRLKQGLTEWYRWAMAPYETEVFSSGCGLCTNLDRYFWLSRGYDREAVTVMNWELKREFRADGLDDLYPFGGSVKYYKHCVLAEAHMMPERLAWVKSKISD